MDTLLGDGWISILLLIFGVAIVLFIISRFLARKVIFLIALMLSFVCVAIVLISIEFVGSWEGMGLGFMTIITFLGIWIGTLTGIFAKKD